MRAVLFPGDSHVEHADLPIPEPGPDEVVIQLTASGICGTDVHYWHESAASRADRAKVVPGHESVGVVASVGGGVTRLHAGDRVVAGMLHIGCGHCRVCCAGEFGLCADKQVFGRDLGGSYAEFVKAPARAVYRLPDDMPDDVAVLAACNLSTAYSALRRGAVGVGETIAVFGLGAVGLCAVLVAAERGAHVIAVDPIAVRRERAAALGARWVCGPDELDAVVGNEHLEVTAAIECSGNRAAQQASIDVLAPGGRTVVVGMGGGFSIGSEELIRKKASLIGSLVCRPDEFFEVLEFGAAHVEALQSLVGPRIAIGDVETGLHHADDGGAGKVIFDWSEGA